MALRRRLHLPREKTELQLAWQVENDTPPIYTDRLKLKVVIKNLMGGSIAVESEVGRGSTFRVWLPAALGCRQRAA